MTPNSEPSRPDEHPELVALGPGSATCDRCMYELYPHAPDTICTDCKLNPLLKGDSKEQFSNESLTHETELSLEELMLRFALGQLPIQAQEEIGE